MIPNSSDVGWRSLNMRKLKAYRPTWRWEKMIGSAACLKWSFRDLANLDAALKFVPGRSAVIQAGGNLGLFPKRLAEEFGAVYTFEPDPHLFEQLVYNAREPNIVKIQAALGSVRNKVKMACHRRDSSGRSSHEGLTHVAGSGIIPQLRIDDFAFLNIDLIYLDIEGFEFFALQGAEETIRRCMPVIVVEINANLVHYGLTADALRKYIVELGYKHVLTMNSDEVFVPRPLDATP